jgi:uncharacterized protein
VADHDFNHAILKDTSHRPWAMEAAPWVMTQTWHNLLFAHWPVGARQLREKVPRQFELDLFEGEAWVGVVPFQMTNVAPRGVPSLPWISAFLEVNVRTYVRVGDRPGVYFFSLDADSALAVRAARTLLNLPYYSASISVAEEEDSFQYESRRGNGAPDAHLSVTYRAVAGPFHPLPGTLEYFLTERYCLYNLDRWRAPYRLEIHHPRWPLQTADARFTRNTMADAAGLKLAEREPLLHFSKRQDMVAWTPTAI